MAKKNTGVLLIGGAGTNNDAELAKVGKEAAKKYGYAQVFVTSDKQVFPYESDARNHAETLENKIIVKVIK